MKPTTAKEIIASLERRFKPDEVPVGYETVVHFDISGQNGGKFTVAVLKDECLVTEGHHGVAKCSIKAKDTVYEKIELGEMNPKMAFMLGRVKVSNLSDLISFTKLFERIGQDQA